MTTVTESFSDTYRVSTTNVGDFSPSRQTRKNEPMSKLPRVLVIDDDSGVRKVLARVLGGKYTVELASSGVEGLRKAGVLKPDLVLLDLKLPEMNGMAVLPAIKKIRGDISIIILTAYGNISSAVQAIKLGATDYLEKPFDNQALLKEVECCIGQKGVRKKVPIRDKIIGESAAIQSSWKRVEQFGPTDIPILLQGETGTGKELFAQAIHQISKRSENPLVAIDCATLPEELMESELFGHEKGAFTGAYKKKAGRVTWANGGSLFLDEIAVLPLSCQAKLLGLVEKQGFIPLGSARASERNTLDVRVISATNVSLTEAVRQGTFREDLYYRLDGVTIELPPLRERDRDLELLVWHFLEKYRTQYNKPDLGISEAAMDILRFYSWPGNIRQLERVMAVAVVLAEEQVSPQDLPQNLSKPERTADSGRPKLELHLDCDLTSPIDLKGIKEWAGREAERHIIQVVRRKLHLNQAELAQFLGVDPKTLRARIRDIEADGPDEAHFRWDDPRGP